MGVAMSAVSPIATRAAVKLLFAGQKDIVIDEALLRQRGGESLRLRACCGFVRQLPHHGAAQQGQKAFQRNVGVGRRGQKREQKHIVCQRRETRVSQQLRQGKLIWPGRIGAHHQGTDCGMGPDQPGGGVAERAGPVPGFGERSPPSGGEFHHRRRCSIEAPRNVDKQFPGLGRFLNG